MDELIVGAISLIAICIIALAFLLAPCGNLRCYTQDCASCPSGETKLTKAVDNYKSGFGLSEEDVRNPDLPFSNVTSSPLLRLLLILLPIIIPIILLLYFFFFTDAGHMVFGVGMIVIGLLIMLAAVFLPNYFRIMMPIGAVLFAMGVIMFTFS